MPFVRLRISSTSFTSHYNACNKSDSITITVQEITKNCNTCVTGIS